MEMKYSSNPDGRKTMRPPSIKYPFGWIDGVGDAVTIGIAPFAEKDLLA